MTIAIKVSSVGKSVISNEAELTILKDISFEVLSGQSVAIVGTSGAGKSTLMTLLAGLDIPSTGDIELLGQNLSQLDDETRAQIRSESIGFVFQSFLLIPSLTALENVTLPAILRGEGEDIKKAKQLLASVGLSGRETHLPSQLSGGEQQRVALARAFMTQPQILFADEPTGNLDQHTAEHIIELLFEMNKKHGTTLVLITHDPKLAERCERTLTIDAGRIFEEVV
ncbi:ATP-binding cassette domain-containing protein [Aliivibrio fischeri]|uniref:ATP-binding cassette domain-containing protein n=1 Tax=Aliivibrio fischeri TaxID=668 RepID=A0A844P5J2_ALIFS|nr:ABC transporter ATP-binding protein [Aliivibrio fischeri]MUK29186.1 ATP-binding cassette domain-containing protein [Aliivibrio fischeri]MUK50535.1 ATP-binding cassette domain-containing protein [Aliivibrio fischeri]